MRISFVVLFILFFGQLCFLADVQPRRAAEFNQPGRGAFELEADARARRLEWNRAAAESSINLYLSAAQLWTKQNRPEPAAACLREAALLNLIAGDERKSAELLRQALETLSGGRHPEEEAKIYAEMSLAALNGGEMDKSKIHFEKALLLARQAEGSPASAAAFYAAGEFYYYSDAERALESYRQAIEHAGKAGDAVGEARSLSGLGYLHLKLSDFAAAQRAFDQALEKSRAAGDRRGQALALKAIGIVRNVMNRKQESLDHLTQAERLFPEDVDEIEKAALYNSIGHVYEDYGEWSLSLKYREKAYRQFQAKNHLQGQMATLPSLGKLSYLSGRETDAAEYFKQAAALARRLGSRFFAAIVAVESADFYFHKGDRATALNYYQKALKSFEPKSDRKYIARASAKIGQIYESQKQSDAARRHYAAALETSREIKDHFTEADALFRLARLDAAAGRQSEALRSIETSIDLTEYLTSNILNSKIKSTYFSNIYERYELFINLLMNLHRQFPEQGFDRRAFQASEKSRSRSMLETLLLTEADFTKDASPEVIGREREIRNLLNLKSDELTNLLSTSPEDAARIEKSSGDINELTAELEDLRAHLKQNSPVYSAVKNPSTIDVAEIQQLVLDEDTALVEFSFGGAESFLWFVGKNQFASYALPARRQIETRIEKLRELLGARELLPGETVEDYQARLTAAESEYRREARALSDELFGQIIDRIRGKRLIIVADGKLHSFPVSALPMPNSENDVPFLLNGEIVQQPAAAMLLLKMKSKRQAQAIKTLAIFSDPVFSAQDARFSGESAVKVLPEILSSVFRQTESLEFLQRLPASRDEAEVIVGILGQSRSAVFSDFAATRDAALSPDIAGYKIIHFATHGLINQERPELSGIVLSLFNKERARQEGLVRLHDIYGLNLSADLVVLSACDTGLGKEIKGEGLQSLTNGFLQAGAKSVVSSLWKVDDYATRDLMKDFYQALVEDDASPPEALRRAQMKMRQKPQYKSPFYWAAFTVQGDYRRPTVAERSVAPVPLLLITLVPVLLLGGYGIYRLRRATSRKQRTGGNGQTS